MPNRLERVPKSELLDKSGGSVSGVKKSGEVILPENRDMAENNEGQESLEVIKGLIRDFDSLESDEHFDIYIEAESARLVGVDKKEYREVFIDPALHLTRGVLQKLQEVIEKGMTKGIAVNGRTLCHAIYKMGKKSAELCRKGELEKSREVMNGVAQMKMVARILEADQYDDGSSGLNDHLRKPWEKQFEREQQKRLRKPGELDYNLMIDTLNIIKDSMQNVYEYGEVKQYVDDPTEFNDAANNLTTLKTVVKKIQHGEHPAVEFYDPR